MKLFRGWRIVKRPEASRWSLVVAAMVSVVAALLVCALLLMAAGANVLEAFGALFEGAFGNRTAFLETVVKSIPFLLTGLAAGLAFRAQIWNIGAEGQLFAGGICGYWAYTIFADAPRAILVLSTVISGVLGGAIWGLLAGVLKAKFGVDEIISTVMLNYVAIYLVSFLVSSLGPWKDLNSYRPQSPIVAEAVQWPRLLPASRLHLGLVLALVAALCLWFLLSKTTLGYRIRAFGLNPTASRLRGIEASGIFIVTMLISGGLAGLAGAGELFGVQLRLVSYLSTGYGFTGIIVAMLGGLDPLATVVAALFMGGLVNGSVLLQITTKVTTALVSAIQAIILLFLLAGQVYARYSIRRVHDSR